MRSSDGSSDVGSSDLASVRSKLIANVSPPVPIPTRRISITNHGERDIARLWRCTESRGAVSPGAAGRSATHRRAEHRYVASRARACSLSNQGYELVTGRARIRDRARMARAARSIHLARGDARQANVRTFCAPDRPVAVIENGRDH